jgi:hypothetical protein
MADISQEAKDIINNIYESAFGFNPLTAKTIVHSMSEEDLIELAIFCVGSVGQVRSNIVIHKGLMKQLIEAFPELEVDRTTMKSAKPATMPSDRINLTGVRYIGYWICHGSRSKTAQALLNKGGSPLTGVSADKTGEVARINKELYASGGFIDIAMDSKMIAFCERVFTVIDRAKLSAAASS